MRIEKTLVVLVVSILVLSGLAALTGGMTYAEEESYDPGISKKLDEILKNQKTMLQSMELLKTELDLIKIRITQQQ